jgi:thiamine kinase-like enzyme
MLLPKSKKSVAVCHNDLNNLNILVNPNDVYLIDYDYAAHNYIGYDIANLINETSFDYSKKQYPGFDVIKTYTAE